MFDILLKWINICILIKKIYNLIICTCQKCQKCLSVA